jgi:hypothetical protein
VGSASGCVYQKECIVAGGFWAWLDPLWSEVVIPVLHGAIKKSFKWRKSFWVGPEAETLYGEGYRLKHDVRRSSKYDLVF